uniref:CBS domain-containing protein n=1 Tax=Fabrea salina TaxID=342563 RepID=A0A7S3MRP5_9CILI|mmetsp:Transcript_1519/g.2445  ORF Transcript_1519/g.2445 Transcript_1519/m.2445 type:complete len:311 (+) Transcript_1519:7-939(+)
MEEHREAVKQSVSKFLRSESLYEMVPASGQVLVLEKGLSLLDVIELTLAHRQEAALVWDPDSLGFVGVITDRDLLEMIISQYDEDDMHLEESQIITKLKSKTLATWREETNNSQLILVNSDDNLLSATQLLKNHRLHRIPILDQKQNLVIGILSMESVLKFFVENYVADSSLFDQFLRDFRLGTSSHIITSPADASLIQALRVMASHKLSSLPLLDENDKILGVLFLSDIPQIIRSGYYLNPQTPVLSVLETVNESGDYGVSRFGILTDEDSMKSLIQKLAASPERKLYKLNENQLELIVTESDLFGYFI